jgi:hypothetical protein
MTGKMTRTGPALAATCGLLVLAVAPVIAQLPATTDSTSAAGEDASPLEALAVRQGLLAERYQQLEVLMLKMAEFDASSNPRRAALLKQALAESKDKHIRLQMEALVKRLRQQQLQRAVDDQTQVRDDLRALLELLLSENREDRLRNEQARIRQYIKELERILRQQRGVQGRTEGGDNPLELADDQQRVADRTGELAKSIDENERPAESRQSGQGGEDSRETPAPDDQQPSDAESSENDPPDEDTPNGETETPSDTENPSDQGSSPKDDSSSTPAEPSEDSGDAAPTPAEGQSGQNPSGQQSNGPPSPPTPAADSPPGQERIAQAEQRMRQAQQRLEEAQRREAIQEQEEARRLLEEAKAELEEVLRQLREEEIQRTLALLEGRFRKMLESQLKVYEETQRLSQIPVDERNSQVVIQAGKLSLEERRLAGDADKALLLLREEGSSVAFPEAVEQMRTDMQQVADRLAEVKVERITLGLEEDIIAALEEMIEALQKAQQEAEQRQQQPRPAQPMSPQDQPLVDAIAELKMIRALQMRVNSRTQRYARLLDDPEHPVGQATSDDLLQSLVRLSEREERIRNITRDIVLGKNK